MSAARSVRPIQWQLPQVSAAQLQLEARVRGMLPDPSLQGHVLQTVHQTLVRFLGPDTILLPDGIRSITFGELVERHADQIVLVVLALPPHNHTMYVQLDREVAGVLVDRVLGGRGDIAEVLVPLTEAEQGCVQFILMNAALAMHTAMGADAPWYARVERVIARRGPAEQLAPPHRTLVEAAFRVGVGERVGAVRLLLPPETIQALVQDVGATAAPTMQHYARFAHERVTLYADAGVCELQVADLGALAAGDIVLLDRAAVQLQQGRVIGGAVLRPAAGEAGLACEIGPDDNLMIVTPA